MIDPRNAGTPVGQIGSQETLVLLDEFASLGFMLHTHHPMTHAAVLDAPATEESVNVRNECPEDLVPSVGGGAS